MPNAAPEGLTARTRETALQDLQGRRARAMQEGQRQNSQLPAGSPMYFYCSCCGLESEVLPETYVDPPKKICAQCAVDIGLGLLDSKRDQMTDAVPKRQ